MKPLKECIKLNSMTIIEKIRAEIERRFIEYNKDSNHHLQAAEDAELLSFLDALEESEKPMNQEELEDEIERYLPTIQEEPYNEELRVFARHFAKWGAEHANGSSEIPNDLEEAAKKHAHCPFTDDDGNFHEDAFDVNAYHDFIAGAKWQKEQSLMESHKAWMDHKSSMIKQIEKAKWQGYDKGLADGTVLGKEQMLNEAVEARVHLEPGANPIVTIGVGRFGLKARDKVRVIVLPKEDI